MLPNFQEQSPSLLPLIVKADISSIQTDVIVYSTGCFISPGYMYKALTRRYGELLLSFLVNRFKIGEKKPESSDVYERKGGLPQGFTSFIPSGELRSLSGADPKAPALVLAVVGGEYVGQITPGSISQLIDNTFQELNRVYPKESTAQKIIAFPTLGLGMGGAGMDRIPPLKAQIIAMKKGQKEYPHLVPVLVTYTDINHRLALSARSKVLDSAKESILIGDEEETLLPRLQQELMSNRLVLFAGAGISQASGLPNWQELVSSLAGEAGIPFPGRNESTEELLETAGMAKKNLGDRFGEALKKALKLEGNSRPLPSITHYLLSALPTKTMVTTNFDSLLEEALQRVKRVAFTIHRPQDVAKAPAGEWQTQILKIHGDLSNPEDIVLSKEDYANYFQKRPAISALLKGLLLNRNFLFVGYSLRDPNLQTILDEVSSLLQESQRSAYAVVFQASEEELEYWEKRKLHLLCLEGETPWEKTLSLWKFLDLLQVRSHAPQGAWLAEDAADLLPEEKRKHWGNLLYDLRKALSNLLEEFQREEDFSPELLDFLYPWMILGQQQGLKVLAKIWNQIAEEYENREPASEATLLLALTAASFAYSSVEGEGEEMYRAKLKSLEERLF